MDNSFLGFAVKSLTSETLPRKRSMVFVLGETAAEFNVSQVNFTELIGFNVAD